MGRRTHKLASPSLKPDGYHWSSCNILEDAQANLAIYPYETD